MNRILVVLATVSAGLLISGCGSIGDGSKPETMIIVENSEFDGTRSDREVIDTADGNGEALRCVSNQLQLYVRFSDGSLGSFTTRANWSSSDESVLTVSNLGDTIPGTDNRLQFPGKILPTAAGSAKVIAEFQGLTAEFDVTVKEIDGAGIRISPSVVTLAQRSSQAFTAEVTRADDNRVVDVSRNVIFAFLNPDDEVAVVGADGVVSVNAVDVVDPNDPATSPKLTLQAIPVVPGCSVDAAASGMPDMTAKATVHIGHVQSVTVEQEENFYSAGSAADENRLPVGFSQDLRITGTFADLDLDSVPDTQDLSGQFNARLVAVEDAVSTCDDTVFADDPTSGTTPSVTFSSQFGLRGNRVFATNPGQPNICARYEPDPDRPELFSNASGPLPLQVIAGLDDEDATQAARNPMLTIATDSADTDPGVIDEIGGTEAFRATLSIDQPLAAGGTSPLSFNANRHVSWTVDTVPQADGSERAVALIGNGNDTIGAGVAISVLRAGDEAATVNVNASLIRGTLDTDPIFAGDEEDIDATSVPLMVSAPAAP